MAPSIADHVRNIPPVTRFFTISSIVVCFAVALGGHSQLVMLTNDMIFTILEHVKASFRTGNLRMMIFAVCEALFQSYRFLSTFLIPSGMLTGNRYLALLDIYGFYTFACDLESTLGKFKGNFPDCLWFTLITGTIIVVTTFVVNLIVPENFPFHHLMMLLCVTYLWSRHLKNATINFMGLVPIKGFFLPLFNLFIKLLLEGGGAVVNSLIGIFGGYLYQCIQSDTLPFYNLLPGAYARFTGSRGGHRVGMNAPAAAPGSGYHADYIEDSIFDKGYLKAPLWLYKLLKYPHNNSKSYTAFVTPNRPPTVNLARALGNSMGLNSSGPVFRGKGHRLGG